MLALLRPALRALIVSACGPALTTAVPAQTTAHLVPADGGLWDRAGSAVALAGDVALVGAPRDGAPGRVDAGAAYVYRRDGGAWTQEARLVAPGEPADAWFGDAVALDGDVAVVGAFRHDGVDDQSGAAHVFRYAAGTWTQEATLVPADGAFLQWFGASVAVDGDVVLVGAPNDNDNGRGSGSAYVFRRADGVWTPEAKLLPSDGAIDEQFGRAVALAGDVALVGADQDGASDEGAAYVFRHASGAWVEEARLTPAGASALDFFGTAVALGADGEGPFAVVGARQDDAAGPGSGAAYVFRPAAGVWAEETQLVPAGPGGSFGGALAADGPRVLVGAATTDVAGERSGAAYGFERSADGVWVLRTRIVPADGAAGDWFGAAVALDAGTALIGAPFDDPRAEDSGSAYVFTTDGVVTGEPGPAARGLALSAPAPQPASGTVRLTLSLHEPGPVAVDVLDTLGRRVAVLHLDALAAGAHTLTFDVSGWASGVYVLQARTGGVQAVRRLVVGG